MEFFEGPPIPSWLEEVYPFHRRIAVIDRTRIHFVDEGKGKPIFLLHGNPTWSFLWRKVIARLALEDVRVVAPDLVGFGLSDKPECIEAHSLEMHVGKMLRLVEALDLREITIVGQDWGGPIVAGVAARASERIRAAVFANTSLLLPKIPIKTTRFHQFARLPLISDLVFRGLNFPVPILDRVQGDPKSIGKFEKRAYSYPFPRWKDRVAPLALARMVPHTEKHPSLLVLKETDDWARHFKGPAALVWGMRDPILGRVLRRMEEAMPHAKVIKTQAGHFLQEEVPQELASAILEVTKR